QAVRREHDARTSAAFDVDLHDGRADHLDRVNDRPRVRVEQVGVIGKLLLDHELMVRPPRNGRTTRFGSTRWRQRRGRRHREMAATERTETTETTVITQRNGATEENGIIQYTWSCSVCLRCSVSLCSDRCL